MNKIVRKIAVTGVSVATAVSLSGLAMVAPAGAQVDLSGMSTADLMSLLTQLQALLGGGTSSACYSFTADLTVGSTGAQVTELQNYLVAEATGAAAQNLANAFAGGVAKGYFGGLTQAAVAEWQAAMGVSPAVGYWGPISRATYNANCTPATDDDGGDTGGDTSADLEGGEGSISVKINASPANNTQVKYDTKTKVFSAKVEAQEGSDIEVGRLDLHFEDRMWLLVDAITVEVDGEEVFSDSSLSSGDFTEITSGSDYRLRIDDNFVIREGDSTNVDVYVTGKSLLSAGNLAKTPEVWMKTSSIRYTDAAGLVQYDGGSTDVASTSSVSREMAFSATGSSASAEAFENASYNPDEGVIITKSGSTTTGKTLLVFDLEIEDNNVELNDVDVDLASVTANLDDIFSLVSLYHDADEDGVADAGELIDAWSGFASAKTDDAEFDNGGDGLALALDEGTHTFIVTGDFKANDGTNYNDGEEVGADLDVSATAIVDGDDFTTVTITPATDVTGPQLHLYNKAPTISNVSVTNFVVQENNADVATGRLEFDITANGGTIYFNGDDAGTATALGVIGDENGSTTTDTYSFTMTGYTSVTNSGATNEYYTLNSGKTGHVTVTVVLDNATTELVGWDVSTLEWGDTSTNVHTRAEFSIDWAELIDQMSIPKVYLIT